MVAVFHAFDRPIYQQLVPWHLANLLCFLFQVLHLLQKGAMSVCLTKSNRQAVALDEAHEMKIKLSGQNRTSWTACYGLLSAQVLMVHRIVYAAH